MIISKADELWRIGHHVYYTIKYVLSINMLETYSQNKVRGEPPPQKKTQWSLQKVMNVRYMYDTKEYLLTVEITIAKCSFD